MGADGREAVALPDRLDPDVAVMDLKMPGMNGVDAAAAILARHPATRVTARQLDEVAERRSTLRCRQRSR